MYTLKLDYLTLNYDAGTNSRSAVSEMLIGDEKMLRWRQVGESDGSPWISPLGLRWVENTGWAPAPHKLEVSGVGCTHFAETLPRIRDAKTSHASRVDFAFDVVMTRSKWKEFISAAFCASLQSDRQRKKYALAGSGEAMTIYIGSRRSAKYFRIYNKTLQDARYEYHDAETGKVTTVDSDHCVIRYEVELKRHKVVSNKTVRLFDPSPFLDLYFGDEGQQAELCEMVKRLWLSFGDEVLLPVGFGDDLLVCKQKPLFCSNSDVDSSSIETVKDRLHDFPHTFDRTLVYVVQKFGKYLPYIMNDKAYRDYCFDACDHAFGFRPDLVIEQKEPAWDEIYDDLDIDPSDLPESWVHYHLDDYMSMFDVISPDSV